MGGENEDIDIDISDKVASFLLAKCTFFTASGTVVLDIAASMQKQNATVKNSPRGDCPIKVSFIVWPMGVIHVRTCEHVLCPCSGFAKNAFCALLNTRPCSVTNTSMKKLSFFLDELFLVYLLACFATSEF